MSLDLDKLKIQILKKDEHSLEVMLDHISNGGSLTELCVMWGLRYSDVVKALRSKPELKAKYDQALKDRDEWARERILSEVKRLGTYTIKDAFNSDGSTKRPHELPDDLAAAIKEVNSDGDIKFQDKLKALDLMGKQLGLFVDKKEISGTLTLEQLIASAKKEIDSE